ncbi:TadE/TadG family type IV pilus assembly protein [Geodermatophilus marinus]|uniref:TadE/TadG family type IV pilus assembly protein n=1 Tax=Geodermatophilus sp. LHW52908 TaxID=2303986 RepID=UPI000E3CDDD6|nr:TadE/TadG family type IV pilus assembly protein [Geodermatophilus sp. LHW52908]RFU19040.1 pilus assembly protein [Geodermatophilus sp. LHW52908]
MRERLSAERGASVVEFALIVPLLVVLVLGIVEFGHAFQVQGTLSSAAREGARVMALQSNPAAARAAVRAAAPTLDPAISDAQIAISPSACPTAAATTTNVRVTIRYPMPFLTGFFGADVDLTGTGVMRCNG